VAPILLIFLRIKLTRVYACHFFLNNSEIRHTKNCIFLTGGVYTPYSPCMSTPLASCRVCRPSVHGAYRLPHRDSPGHSRIHASVRTYMKVSSPNVAVVLLLHKVHIVVNRRYSRTDHASQFYAVVLLMSRITGLVRPSVRLSVDNEKAYRSQNWCERFSAQW